MHTYAAAACLLREKDTHGVSEISDYQGLIDYAMSYLSRLESTSAVAKTAIQILRSVNRQQAASMPAIQ